MEVEFLTLIELCIWSRDVGCKLETTSFSSFDSKQSLIVLPNYGGLAMLDHVVFLQVCLVRGLDHFTGTLNGSLRNYYFPSSWRDVRITPIPGEM